MLSVDGLATETGIWVKGEVVERNGNDHYVVKHFAWGSKEGLMTTRIVHVSDIRNAY